MDERVVKFKLIGKVEVALIKEPPLQVRIKEQMKEKLGIDFDPDKHAYLHVPPKEAKLGGSITYEIFEKMV